MFSGIKKHFIVIFWMIVILENFSIGYFFDLCECSLAVVIWF